MNVNPSARKQGVRAEDALHAATHWAYASEPDENDPARQLRLGFYTSGRLLEIIVLQFDSGNELIIHAIKARTSYMDLLDLIARRLALKPVCGKTGEPSAGETRPLTFVAMPDNLLSVGVRHRPLSPRPVEPTIRGQVRAAGPPGFSVPEES